MILLPISNTLKYSVILLCLCCSALFAVAQGLPQIVEVRASAEDDASSTIERHSLGFIVEREGFLLTSYQSLTMPGRGTLLPRIEVRIDSGAGMQTYPGEIIGVEPTLNFAVLKIHREGGFEASRVLREENLIPGDKLFAATQTEVSAESFVSGRLSAMNSKECYQADLTATMFAAEIEIPDTGIGGPVFNEKGEVLGMFTGYHPPELAGEEALAEPDEADASEVTHILPIFLAFNIYDSIKQRQSLASPWTGFSVRPLNASEREQFPVAQGKFTGGIAFEYIWENSPAEAMGLQVDDILLRFAYYPILSPADFQKWLYMYGVGRTVKLYLLRDGEIFIKEYTIEARPDWAQPL